MSHYDPTIVVGSGTRGGGGPRPVAVKTKAQINAAARMGNLTTAKNQFRAANSAASSMNGQRDAAIDRNPDIVKPKPKDNNLESTFRAMVRALGIKEREFAQRAGLDPKKVFTGTGGSAVEENTIIQIQAHYGMWVKGEKKGTLHGKPMKTKAYRALLAKEFPKLLEEDKPATKSAATKPAATKPAATKPAAKKP